jgi:thiol-disulfide isomerase/thioredoxin
MRTTKRKFPTLVFLCFAAICLALINYPEYDYVPYTGKTNKDLPLLSLVSISSGNPMQFPANTLYIVSVFSSWCRSCKMENKELLALKTTWPGVPIYGLLLMDKPENAKKFLQISGNPYKDIAIITEHEATTLGVSAMPEIFLVNDDKVIYRFRGTTTANKISYAIQNAFKKIEQL